MTTIIDDLGREHARFRKFITWYEDEIRKLVSGETPDYTLMALLATYFTRYPDELHHKKEDILYARLTDMLQGRDHSLGDLHKEHAELSTRAASFAKLISAVQNDQEIAIDLLAKEAADYFHLLTTHMAGEEDKLFRPALAHFKEDDWSRIHEDISELYVTEINRRKARQILEIEDSLESYKAD